MAIPGPSGQERPEKAGTLLFLLAQHLCTRKTTFHKLRYLAGLVLVRTFLSISLGVEINGHWPWEETRMAREKARAASDGSPATAEAAGCGTALKG